jgi:MFS family permease
MTCWRRSSICRLGDQVGGWPTWTPTGLPDSSPAMDRRHHGDVGARLLGTVRVRAAGPRHHGARVPARTIGTASAVNCLVIVVLQMAVVKWTARRSARSLLVAVGSIWVLAWLLLAAASVVPVLAGAMFIVVFVVFVVFGVFAVSGTMYSPVLSPLTASLAPSGMVGTTLGIFAALQTGVSAAGPMLAGADLTAGHASLFIGVRVGIRLVAVFAALRLRSLLAGECERQPAGRHPGDARRARPRGTARVVGGR